MATKTLILRPTRVTCNNESLITLYPSDTTMTNAHMLVNEEVADDDATYIAITGGNGNVRYYFTYDKPDDLVAITNIVIKKRERLESGTNAGSHSFQINDSTISLVIHGSISSSEYSNVEATFSDNALTNIINHFDNVNKDTPILYVRNTANDSKMSPLRMTQVYMEITYETSEEGTNEPLNSGSIYLKKDNVYNLINYNSVYYKFNDSWKLVNLSIVQNEEKYIIKEVE